MKTFDVVANTQNGQVGGKTINGVNIFKGIRYGASTAGSNRFKPPKPVEPWDGIFDATEFGPTAPQRSHAEMGTSEPDDEEGKRRKEAFGQFLHGIAGDEPAQSEDCLRINIWSKGLDSSKSRAVMVWLHGGAFESGSGSWPLYDGTPLASRDDTVVVTINHRLGVLGFLYLDEVGGEEYTGSGNAGMLDIVQALRWIQDNIQAFGGDPSKVMVFGSSGGASKTSTLLAMPSAKGLFHRGVLMSGPMMRVRTAEHAAHVTNQLLDRLNLTPNEIGKLHDYPYQKLLSEAAHLALPIDAGLAGAANPEDFMPMQPVVDGSAIPVQPMEPVASPFGADVEIMIGSTKDDMKMMMLSMPWFGKLDEAGLAQIFSSTYGEISAPMLAAYRRAYPAATPTDIACQSVTDRVMWAGAIEWAERKSVDNAPVFVYRFDFETPIMGGILGATHGGDIPLAMNNYSYTPMAGDRPDNTQMAEIMSEAFVQFAHSGNPNHPVLPEWKPYNAEERNTLVFDLPCRTECDPHSELRQLHAQSR
jgi:para-nitrobenzyl esterase